MQTNVFRVYNDIYQHGAVYALHNAISTDGLLRAVWLVYVAKAMHRHTNRGIA
jgi:hypothetical protein